jgi:hypothetical protein
MAAPAPTAPAPAAAEAPAAKRQKLATTAVKWTAPEVTHTWTLEGLTLEAFTGAPLTVRWEGPDFEALQ